MKTYHRHFVSQHLGKATVHVDDDGGGHVVIAPLALPEQAIVFSFDPAHASAAIPDPAQRGEAIARTAIGQLHRELSRGACHVSGELVLGTLRWQGDLLDNAYGGATEGFHR